MGLPNPLASRRGRLMAFFLLYVTEGIPLGFTASAMVIQLQNAGVRPLAISAFFASLYFPWAWKWVVGPFVDLIYSNRLGARRGWILGTQFSMVATLLVCMPFEVSSANLTFLTAVILIHNTFCATQDVAIDALACTVLPENEQGLGNGFMFAGQKIGFALGGACVLYLTKGFDIPWLPDLLQQGVPFQLTYPFIIACILAVTIFVALPMREAPREQPPADESQLTSFRQRVADGMSYRGTPGFNVVLRSVIGLAVWIGSTFVKLVLPKNLGSRIAEVRLRLGEYIHSAGRAVFGSRVAFAALVLALLPPGAMGLDMALQKQVAKEVGFTDTDVADIDLVSSIVWALACVVGGFISDRIGHLKCLAVFFVLISIPTFWCASKLDEAGMNVPKKPENVSVIETAAGTIGEAVAVGAARAAAGPQVETKAGTAGVDAVKAVVQVASHPDTALPKPDKPKSSVFSEDKVPAIAGQFWWAVMAYMVFQGLMYGTRTAVFMRIANPDVAATQFTAYMSMMNLVTSYSALWQGFVIEQYGFAQTLFADGIIGLLCIGVLPFLRPPRNGDNGPAKDLAIN